MRTCMTYVTYIDIPACDASADVAGIRVSSRCSMAIVFAHQYHQTPYGWSILKD